MTRSQTKINGKSDISKHTESNNVAENSWILLAKDTLLKNSEFDIMTLPHPAHSKPTKYCLDEIHKKVFEVVTFNEPHRCWFTKQAVKSDASMLIMTPVNPVFLVLPLLRNQCNNRAIPLQDLMSNKCFGKLFNFITGLDQVADLKGPLDLKAYKYNEMKTLAWLENKVFKLAKVLKEKNIHVSSGAISATFVASNISSDTVDQEFFLKYALGMIAEYVEADLVEILEKKFDFKPDMIESLGQKRKSEVGESNTKRIKNEQNEINIHHATTTQVSNHGKEKSLSAKEKARQKAASGTKTISSFFTKKL